MSRFIVEHDFLYGWDNAGWTDDDKPCVFTSRKKAQVAIDEFIKDQHDAVAAGAMMGKYSARSYRVAEIKSLKGIK